ncbi:TAXI family TRAP transporter solute-binding subunit [Ruegeria jejuensis]|uniref:TAXI family TRAP transporter solute-binding subunit n=1 Tax=Ruegeria jejuensis TaxID=3233338 RepID=UPI00355BCD91
MMEKISPFAVALTLLAGTGNAEDAKITIGTGGKTGVYFRAGEALCDLSDQTATGLRCRAKSSGGSFDNLVKLRSNSINLAIARSDWVAQAVNGIGRFNGAGPDKDLRSLYSLHAEPLNIIARRDSGIRSLDDLKGKRVNFGSWDAPLVQRLLRAKGWESSDFAKVVPATTKKQGKLLCAGEFDAIIYTVGFPSLSIFELTKSCPVRFVDAGDPAINRLVKSSDELSRATIPGGMYRGVDDPVETFGYRASVVTRADIPDAVVYEFVKSTMQDTSKLRSYHPAWHALHPRKMTQDGLVAPLHPGAAKYYRERGWIK